MINISDILQEQGLHLTKQLQRECTW